MSNRLRVFLIEEKAMVRKALRLVADSSRDHVALLMHERLTDFAYLLMDWKAQVLVVSLSYLSQDIEGLFSEYQKVFPVPLVGVGTKEEINVWQQDRRFREFIGRPFAPGDFFHQLQLRLDL